MANDSKQAVSKGPKRFSPAGAVVTAAAFMLVFLLVGMTAGCAVNPIGSIWKDHEILVNGADDDWPAAPVYYDKDRQLVVRAMNDHAHLHLCMAFSDRKMIGRFAVDGLTVWIDPKGEKNKAFGICIPGRAVALRSDRAASGAQPPENEKPPSFAAPEKIKIIFSNDGIPVPMDPAVAALSGVEIGVAQTGGRLVCELKIAIKGERSVLEIVPGALLGVGIESVPLGRGRMMERSRSEGTGPATAFDGKGGMGGGMGESRAERRRPGARGDEPFEVWLKIRLAQQAEG